MAKVSCNYIKNIPTMNKEDLYKPYVFVVDMINGFIKEGNMSDPSIMEIVPSIISLLKDVHPSIFICDAHDLDAKEFDAYPIHCIKHTSESEVIDELKPYAKNTVTKNSTNAFLCEGIQKVIKEELKDYNDLIIVGCCSDICILQFALCLNTYINQNELKDKRVIVPINMIETFNSDGHDAMKFNEIASTLMINNAVQVVEMK